MSDLRSNFKIVAFFWRHASKYPAYLWGMIITLPLAVLFSNFLPALVSADILDRLSSGDFVKGDLWGSFGGQIALAIGLAALGTIVIWRINIFCNWKLEGLVTRDINQRVFDHLMRMSASFHANHFGGSLVSQTSKLANAYVRITDTTMFQVSTLFWTTVFTNVLLWNKALLFVLLLDAFCVIYIACALLITKRIRLLNQQEADASNKVTGHLADSITNAMAVKSFAASKTESKQFATTTESARQATLKLMGATLKVETGFSTIGTIIGFISLVMAVASVVVYGADIATVFLVFAYSNNIRDRLWDFSTHALRNYNRGFGDAQAMTDILATTPSVQDPAKPEEPRIHKGAIAITDLHFNHDGTPSGEGLFQGLNLHIKPSEKIGLVGHSGSGKTSLTKLLLRFNDVSGGSITIDGQNIAHITQDDLRRSIAYVPQEPLLFHRSIRENIAYGKPDASDDEMITAAKKANAHEFIVKLPDGYDTTVGERGVKLSGGQRQRVAIARAILKDAPILVLDEATSALDSESEVLIQEALWELMKNRTAIVIAHRLSTVQKMDRIIVMEDGTITEQGTHAELISKRGTYAQLWAHQSGGFIEE